MIARSIRCSRIRDEGSRRGSWGTGAPPERAPVHGGAGLDAGAARRGGRRLIAEGLAEKDLLTSAEPPAAPDRLLAMAAIVHSDPKVTLRERDAPRSDPRADAARRNAMEARRRGACDRMPSGSG